MQSLCILGRQPALGLAELESLYGSEVMRRVGTQAVVIDIDPSSIIFKRLGGSVKLCKVLTVLSNATWAHVQKFLVQVAPEHASRMPEGKMHLGLSAYGIQITKEKIGATGLTVKKAIRKDSGRSVRLVPNNELELATAQIIHNNLLTDNGWELVFVQDGADIIIAQTLNVQNIESYTLRDRGRPKRDARVGMLPPKLAQILVNLTAPTNGVTVLDPFCGTGVVLQEAALMGYNVYGTDIEQRMIDYTHTNLGWLNKTLSLSPLDVTLEAGDATNHQWTSAPVSVVASETYLGRPLTTVPDAETLNSIRHTCDQIISGFLKNLATQIPAGTKLCIAVPAWNTKRGFIHLKTLDSLEVIGYNQISFEHAARGELLYYRPDQIVARELLVLTKS